MTVTYVSYATLWKPNKVVCWRLQTATFPPKRVLPALMAATFCG